MGHDVVDLGEDESAARGEGPDPVADVGGDFLGRPQGQDALGVAAAAPERDVLAEFPLEPGRVHPLRARLDGVDDVDADLDQVGEDVGDRPAGMEKDFQAGVFLDEIEQDLLAGFEDFPVHPGGNLQAVLRPQVVAHLDDFDKAVDGRKEPRQARQGATRPACPGERRPRGGSPARSMRNRSMRQRYCPHSSRFPPKATMTA